MTEFEKRVEKIERSNRRLKIMSLLMCTVFSSILLVGMKPSSTDGFGCLAACSSTNEQWEAGVTTADNSLKGNIAVTARGLVASAYWSYNGDGTWESASSIGFDAKTATGQVFCSAPDFILNIGDDWMTNTNRSLNTFLNQVTANQTAIANLQEVVDACCSSACSEDTNADGDVDVTDLMAIMAAWGACPS